MDFPPAAARALRAPVAGLALLGVGLALAALASASAPQGWENATLADPPLVDSHLFAAPNTTLWFRVPGGAAKTLHLRAEADTNLSYGLYREDLSGAPNLTLYESLFINDSDPTRTFPALADYPSWNASDWLVALAGDPLDLRAASGSNITLSLGSFLSTPLDPGAKVSFSLSGHWYGASYYDYILNTSALGGQAGLWSVAVQLIAHSAPAVEVNAFLSCYGPPLCGRDDFPAAYDRIAIFPDGAHEGIGVAHGSTSTEGAGFNVGFPDASQGLVFFGLLAAPSTSGLTDISATVNISVMRLPPGAENADDAATNATNVTSHAPQRGSLVLESDFDDWFAFAGPAGGLRINGSFSGTTYSDFPERAGYLVLTPELLVFDASMNLVAAVNSEFDPHTFNCYGCAAAGGSFLLDMASPPLTEGSRYFAALIGRPNGADIPSSHYQGRLDYSLTFQFANRAPYPRPGALNYSLLEDTPGAVDLAAAFIDHDGDALTFSAYLGGAELLLSFSLLGTNLSFTPGADGFGNASFSLTVTDRWPGGSGVFALTLFFAPVEDPPSSVGVLPTVVWDQGTTSLPYNVTPYFSDPDPEPLSFVAGLPPQVSAASCGAGCFTFLPIDNDTFGNFTGNITARDPAGASASLVLRLTVQHVNRPPAVNASAPPNITLISGKGATRLAVGDFCHDPDGDALALAYLGAMPTPDPFGAVPAPTGPGDLLLSVSDPSLDGNWTVALECRDPANARARFDLAVEVRLADYPPYFRSRAPPLTEVNAPEDSSLLFGLEAVDPEGDSLIYWWKIDGRSVTNARSNTTLLWFTFVDAGIHTVEGFASDPAGHTISLVWTLVVSDVDRPPTCAILVTDGTQGPAGTLRHLAADGFDPDGDPLSYTWAVNDTFASGDDAFAPTLAAGTLKITLSIRARAAQTNCSVVLAGVAAPATGPTPSQNATAPPNQPGFLPGPGVALAGLGLIVGAGLAGQRTRKRRRMRR